MPILPLEPFLFPEELLAVPEGGQGKGGGADTEQVGRWWVLHTRPRAEKALARRFFHRGLSFFLPLYPRQSRSRGRVLCSHVPLFAGYVFLHGDEEARLHALETNLVARWLPVPDQRRLHQDLARVYRLITVEAAMTPEDRLIPGTPVEIISGPLVGLEGTVLRRGSQLRIFVEVQFLQRGVSVEIESWMLQPLTN